MRHHMIPRCRPSRSRPPIFGFLLALVILVSLAPAPAMAQPLAWTQQLISGPSPRSYHAMAYDSTRAVTVLFGGSATSAVSGETWECRSTGWTQQSVSGPSPRYWHAMAYDSARGVTVLFGGLANIRSAETWEWNGTSWTQRPVSGPSPRYGHAMAYDSARGVTVLFGGNTNGSNNNGETWEWNGTAWTQRTVSGPSARFGHAMAYDTSRGVSVLFGGNTDLGRNRETWEWNGTSWTQRSLTGPSARYLHSMTYDAARSVTVLFGGNTSGSTLNGETWEWTATGWTQPPVSGPSPRWLHAAAYDASRAVTVLFGGLTGFGTSGINGETWSLSGCVPFIAHPSSVALTPGASASFAVAVAESSAATTYRWRRSGIEIADGPRIMGTATATLMITSVQSSDQGTYDCVATRACGSETSRSAALSCAPILLSQPPAAVLLVAGLQLSVTVPAGASYSYRWRRNGQNLFNVPDTYSGTTTPTLTILRDDPSLGGTFDVVATNVCGTTTSSPTIVACTPVILFALPASLPLRRGAQLTVSAASGGTPSIQWRRNGAAVADIAGVLEGTRTTTLRFGAEDPALQGNYDVVITNVCGSATSSITSVACAAPLIVMQPDSSTRLAAGITLKVATPPSSGYGLNWRQAGQNLVDIPGLITGTTTDTLLFHTVDPSLAGAYDCRLTSPCGIATTDSAGVFCPSDFNHDFFVDPDDLGDFIACFFTTPAGSCPAADFNGDGNADPDDLADFIATFFTGC